MAENKSTKMGKGLAIASMVCGIVAVAFCWTLWISLVCAIVALALGIVALVKKADGKGMAITGVVTGGVGLAIAIILYAFVFSVANKVVEAVESADWEETTEYLESWSDEVDECLEANGIDPDTDYDDMTAEQQDIYFDCMF